MTSPREHDLFYKMIDGLKQAESAARELAWHQADKPWRKVADNLKEMQGRLFDLESRPMLNQPYKLKDLQ